LRQVKGRPQVMQIFTGSSLFFTGSSWGRVEGSRAPAS
jgi:hypothetical protein